MTVTVARPRQALAFCRAQRDSGSTAWFGLCLSLARQARGLPGVYPDAWTAWVKAEQQHACTSSTVHWDQVPVGAPLLYRGGEHGHIATFVGVTKAGPLCWTNDAAGHGLVSMVNPLWFEAHWAHYLVGWTGDLNGYDLTPDPPVEPPKDPPPSDPPAAHPAIQNWRRAKGDVIRIGKAVTDAQPNRPLLRAILERDQADWATLHQAEN